MTVDPVTLIQYVLEVQNEQESLNMYKEVLLSHCLPKAYGEIIFPRVMKSVPIPGGDQMPKVHVLGVCMLLYAFL